MRIGIAHAPTTVSLLQPPQVIGECQRILRRMQVLTTFSTSLAMSRRLPNWLAFSRAATSVCRESKRWLTSTYSQASVGKEAAWLGCSSAWNPSPSHASKQPAKNCAGPHDGTERADIKDLEDDWSEVLREREML